MKNKISDKTQKSTTPILNLQGAIVCRYYDNQRGQQKTQGFFLSTIFYFIFSHTTQHNIQNATKQNNRHILNISRSNQKGGGGGRTTRTQKLLLYIITYIQQKTLPSINGRRPGPTNSRRCTFTWHNLQEATDPICFSKHVWCKPVLDYCLLHSCKTSKQHSLLHWTNTETRIIIKKTQTCKQQMVQ